MIIMQVAGLSLDSTAKTPILILKSVEDERMLPIWIGAMEAMSISLALSGQTMLRPLTHDLTVTMLATLEAHISAVEIYEFKEGTFYAVILMRKGEEVHRIDCRPSDGIALALRTSAPIAVHPKVLDEVQHKAQRQDGTSFQLLREDGTDAGPQQTAKIMTEVVENIRQINPAKPSVTTTQDTATQDEQDLAKLLQSLEPQSSRRM